MKAFTQPLHDLSEYEQIVSDLAGHRTPIHIDGCIDSQKCISSAVSVNLIQ